LLAERARKMRKGTQVGPVLPEQRRGWSLMIFCARATRGRGLPSLDARSGRSIRPHLCRVHMLTIRRIAFVSGNR
jgi:hypothetical protein